MRKRRCACPIRDSFAPLSMESYRSLGWLAMQFLCTQAGAAASSATAGLDVPTSTFVMGALRELSLALVKRSEAFRNST
jgi:hypothetical protein